MDGSVATSIIMILVATTTWNFLAQFTIILEIYNKTTARNSYTGLMRSTRSIGGAALRLILLLEPPVESPAPVTYFPQYMY